MQSSRWFGYTFSKRSAYHHVSVFVKITPETKLPDSPVVFEASEKAEWNWGVHAQDCLLAPTSDGAIRVSFTNPATTTRIMTAVEVLGYTTPVTVVTPEETEMFVGRILSVTTDPRLAASQDESRRTKLMEAVGELDLPPEEREAFQEFLMHHHHAFSLEDG